VEGGREKGKETEVGREGEKGKVGRKGEGREGTKDGRHGGDVDDLLAKFHVIVFIASASAR